jgi:hypothetical protein
MAAAIQADSHRYVTCHDAHNGPTLEFCVPNETRPVVTYTVQSGGPPYDIVRKQPPGPSVLMARGVRGQPNFWSECGDDPGKGTVYGHIHVYQYRAAGGRENFSVYYHAPRPAGGCTH